MQTLANRMSEKIRRLPNADLMGMLKPHAKDLHDWRNWGRNFLKVAAEEAHERGLI